nr:restriction endonuclease subunit S [uncultured Desulfobacter sp.]
MIVPNLLPPNWISAPLKRFLAIRSGDMISATEECDGDIPIYGGNGIRGYTDKINTKAPAIVIGRVGAKCGNIHLVLKDFWASEHAFVVYPNKKFSLRYGMYLLTALNLNQYAIRTAQPLLNTEAVVTQNSSWPVSFEKQSIIANYLDKKTAEIDRLITAKKNLLSLLDEKKQAVIAHAVTRGLDPDVGLKDSGIPWLGLIPEHWKVERVTNYFEERDDRCRPELPLLVVSIHSGVSLRKLSQDKIEQRAEDYNSYKVALKNDIVFNKMRMWQGAVGAVPCDGLVSPDYVVAYPSEHINSNFFGMLFKTGRFSDECGSRSHGIVWDRLRLYWDEFKDISIPIPPLEEQQQIVIKVKRQTAQISDLKKATEKTISLLQERRAALISAAVTGKIDQEVLDAG